MRWRGYIADRDRLYGDLDILVAPAIDEPFGLTVAEAGSYGLPVVAARSGAFPELIENGRTGLLFAPGDAADLASSSSASCSRPTCAAGWVRRGASAWRRPSRSTP